ncbi:uncharacterized protein [Diadema antillarum]|uniref:uncharacterized protein n=1 Tax=Diadema antillarum TaxID=105358 RepID=UPI003A877412
MTEGFHSCKEHIEQAVVEEFEDELDEDRDEEIVFPNVERETKGEEMKRFFASQEVETHSSTESKPAATMPQPNPSSKAPEGLERMFTSLEGCLAQLTRVTVHQSMASQQLAASSQLPKIDVPPFSGDPLQYPLWKNAFISLVDSKPLDNASKLNFLCAFVCGKPKEIVEHHLLIGDEDGYKKAREQLEERYGHASTISVAFTKKLNSWGRIGHRDASGLRDYSDFLVRVRAAKHSCHSLGILDYPQEHAKLVERLPPHSFSSNRTDKPNKARTFAINGTFDEKKKMNPSPPTASKHGPYSSCPFCAQDHHIDECEEFAKMSLAKRKTFFFQKMLCMGCGTTDEHLYRNCKERKACKTCGKAHLTCLHMQGTNPLARQDDGSANCTSVCSLPDQHEKDNCMIVPVWLRHKDNPTKERLVYAILDDQSNVSFVSKSATKELNVKENFRTRGLGLQEGECGSTTSSLRTREILPISRPQIPKPEVAKRWPHLRPIADKMMPYSTTVEVSLLIGNDCTRAIRPREIITGGEDDPYAQRSLLGWGIIGRVCKTQGESLRSAACNKISVETYSNFAFPTKTKEVLCPQKIIQTLEADFKDMSGGQEPLSVEDRRFLQRMEEGIKKRDDGHYEMPLPFKSEDVRLPHNRQMAVKRWNQLNARFRKNPKFLADYQEFIRRGPVRQIRCDRGTAFVGARNELQQALKELDEEQVKDYLKENDTDWIPFEMNTPHSSHMGGAWERQIATVRRALEPLLINSSNQLDDESFRTFLAEVELIVNTRPLTTTNLCSPDAPEPLTPNHLLTMKPKVVLPPPGKFQRADAYCRKWWRRVQHLTNEFWLRWRKEFLIELQARQKWVQPKRDIRVGDVVIIKEADEARRCWPLGRVEEVFAGKDGHVRKVRLLMATKMLDTEGMRHHRPSFLERPIQKLVVLVPAEEVATGEEVSRA